MTVFILSSTTFIAGVTVFQPSAGEDSYLLGGESREEGAHGPLRCGAQHAGPPGLERERAVPVTLQVLR